MKKCTNHREAQAVSIWKSIWNFPMIRTSLLLFILIPSVYAENIGSIFLGTSNIGGHDEFRPRKYEVNYGASAGFLLPIRFPFVDAHYKVRAADHSAQSNRINDHFVYEYISASNVLLVGKQVDLKTVSLLPQMGLGLLYELIHHDWETGYMYNLLFIDYSLKLNIPSLQEHWGLLFNLEHGIDSSNPGYSPNDRFHVSLIYTY